jgi:RIO kinase 1
MKVPKRLQPLVDDGMVDEVLYQLMSGKEAQV